MTFSGVGTLIFAAVWEVWIYGAVKSKEQEKRKGEIPVPAVFPGALGTHRSLWAIWEVQLLTPWC